MFLCATMLMTVQRSKRQAHCNFRVMRWWPSRVCSSPFSDSWRPCRPVAVVSVSATTAAAGVAVQFFYAARSSHSSLPRPSSLLFVSLSTDTQNPDSIQLSCPHTRSIIDVVGICHLCHMCPGCVMRPRTILDDQLRMNRMISHITIAAVL